MLIRRALPSGALFAALLALAAALLPAAPASAAVACGVGYTVTNQWPGGFGAAVTLTNLGDPVAGWRLTWTFATGQSITQMWNATPTQSGTAVTAASLPYNANPATGAAATFGFNGGWTTANPVPASFAMNGVTCTGSAPTSSPTPTRSPTPTPTPGGCTVQPVNPTPQARRLLCYLYSQYGNHILSGQQESTWIGGPDYENTSFRERLDGAAALQQLKNAGAAVIWRPFHEAGGAWFWWSKEGGAQYNRLWRYMYDYFTNTKGLNNLIWLHGYNGSPQSAFYPGKQYVDIGGADTYAGDGNYDPQKAMYDATRAIVGTTVPIALHENGPIPDPDRLQSTGARWVLFGTWHGNHLTVSNSADHLRKVYGHSYVVTRDELPNLR
ncbi:hypothetical protein Acor_23540 [Acrocarpospora corrugata]|uniref:CBM2 domain-containing protein n=1 Tax=Acrocarpospora corrugata TaxID=35763 RepID=A0A5M3VZM1_9ACTN|nr:glycosyl hydrolase [Acrocarpospora corrugata]GES00291.1 hypothetical protein Acor_23540 [Acrocarpospora corrugata]